MLVNSSNIFKKLLDIKHGRVKEGLKIEKAKAAARKAKETSDALVKEGQRILLNKAASEAPINAGTAIRSDNIRRAYVTRWTQL